VALFVPWKVCALPVLAVQGWGTHRGTEEETGHVPGSLWDTGAELAPGSTPAALACCMQFHVP
jgi:hypothetical protein